MFANIPPLNEAKFYVDKAFRKARTKVDEKRGSLSGTPSQKARDMEGMRVSIVGDILVDECERILKSFPSIDSLPMIYQELIKNNFDYGDLKKSLGAVNWAKDIIRDFQKEFSRRIHKAYDSNKAIQHRIEFYGKIATIFRKINKNLAYLEQVRYAMRDFPDIKQNVFTVCITGFPNVGKSTLLNKLTGSKAEVDSYAFTTKRLNVATGRFGIHKVQFVDTPGALNRFEKMNTIEKQAYLAMKHSADLIVYVFDLTETYPIKDQMKLYELIREFGKKVLVYVSKTDVTEEEEVRSFGKKYDIITDSEELKKIIVENLSQKTSS